jgi:outer membrane protein assembly factor BamB
LSLKLHVLIALVCAMLLNACTSITDLKADVSERLFGRQITEIPSELDDIKSTVEPKVLWSNQLGAIDDDDFTPVVDKDFVYAVGSKGELVKIIATTGKDAWRVNVAEPVSGGVGVGENLVLIGTKSGYVVAHNLDGKMLWKAKVSSQVLSAPQVDLGTVVVRCGDSRIYGLNAVDGSRKWVYERATPPLSLKSSAGVVLDGGAVYAGFAGGKLISLRVDDGTVLWEVSVAQPKGTTEIERIADITSQPVVDGPLVYAVAYQGKIAAVDRATGRIAWNRDISSYTGLNAEDARIFVSHANSAVYALDFSTGKTYWRQGDLRQRRISAPLPMGNYIALGDVEGYIHLLSREDGGFVGRVQLEESPILPQMTALGSHTIIAQNRKGGIYAISLK